MEMSNEKLNNASFDPKDWAAFRSLSYEMVDESINFLQKVRETPIYNVIPIPQDVHDKLNEPLPEGSQDLGQVCEDFKQFIFPYPLGNVHPRFWGWAAGTGTAGGIIAQLMAATMNSHSGGGAQVSTLVERQVLRWCREMFQFPDTSSGLLVTGTSMATIIALTIARNHALEDNYKIRLEGIIGGPRLVGYASTETHFCILKAFELLGLGRNALRLVPVNADFCIDLDQLEKTLLDDVKLGYTPFCVIGNAGTVSTGSIDNLLALKNFSLKYKLWFHVDGAFGALAILDELSKERLVGIEQADSLAFDFHKWLHVPFDAGCVLLREKQKQLATFSSHGRYITKKHIDDENGFELFFQYGPELTRGFRALSVWFTLKEHGVNKLGQKIRENCEQAKYLAELLGKHSWIELITPISLNIVCFRIRPETIVDNENDINTLNNKIVVDIQQSGIAIPSTAVLNDRLYIRCCIMNHRTVYDDCHVFVNELLRTVEKYSSK